MKFLSKLALLSFLSVFATPSTLANTDDELLDQNLEDYFDFEIGTWWNYTIETTDYEGTSNELSRYTEYVGCDSGSDCWASEDSGGLTEFTLDSRTLSYTKINDLELSKHYTLINLEGYEEEIEVEDYAAFSIEGAQAGAMVICEYSLLESYEFSDKEDIAILENCSLTGTSSEGFEFEMLTETTYLKGVGLTESMTRLYSGGYLVLQASATLDTSSLLIDSPFTDLATTHDNYTAIAYLNEEGVLDGYSDGSFKSEGTVNRAELLKILVEGNGVTPDADTYKNCFPDVNTDWYAKYVCYAKEEGWVSGYPDGTFRPADSVNKVEALKMLLNSKEVSNEISSTSFKDVDSNDWFVTYVATAESMGILEENGSYFGPDAERTRGGISENLYRLILSVQVENTSIAMAESACLYFNDSLDEVALEEATQEIMETYGFENADVIDDYLALIRSIEVVDYLISELASDMEEGCGEALEEIDLDPQEFAEIIVAE